MGRILLVVALASCTHATASSVAWPKTAVADKDGGESLAPHQSKSITVAIEKSDEPKPEPKPEVKAAPAVVTDGGGGAAQAAAVTQAIDEVITTEEIIIEVDD